MCFDRKLIEADIEGSKAYARALSCVKILTPVEASRIADALDQVLAASEAKLLR